MSLFQTPAFFGIQDVTVDTAPTAFGMRIYYPTLDDLIVNAPLAKGPHPLVVFAHGNRQGPQNAAYCPVDKTNDYRRWTRVLGALARSGFVIAAPDLSDVSYGGNATDRLQASVQWMRNQWSGRQSLHKPPVRAPLETLASSEGGGRANPHGEHVDISNTDTHTLDAGGGVVVRGDNTVGTLGEATALVVMGHSWGGRAGATFAASNHAQAYVSIAGSFDDNESVQALTSLAIPKFMLAGTADPETLSYLNGVWRSLHAPKYQCALRDVGHWDWFGSQGAIRRCDDTPTHWPDTAQVAGELIAGFLTRHVGGVQFAPPHLVRIPLLPPWHVRWQDQSTAVQMRWDAPGQDFGELPATGSGILGLWPSGTALDW